MYLCIGLGSTSCLLEIKRYLRSARFTSGLILHTICGRMIIHTWYITRIARHGVSYGGLPHGYSCSRCRYRYWYRYIYRLLIQSAALRTITPTTFFQALSIRIPITIEIVALILGIQPDHIVRTRTTRCSIIGCTICRFYRYRW
jgi:hypothetical protein